MKNHENTVTPRNTIKVLSTLKILYKYQEKSIKVLKQKNYIKIHLNDTIKNHENFKKLLKTTVVYSGLKAREVKIVFVVDYGGYFQSGSLIDIFGMLL